MKFRTVTAINFLHDQLCCHLACKINFPGRPIYLLHYAPTRRITIAREFKKLITIQISFDGMKLRVEKLFVLEEMGTDLIGMVKIETDTMEM